MCICGLDIFGEVDLGGIIVSFFGIYSVEPQRGGTSSCRKG